MHDKIKMLADKMMDELESSYVYLWVFGASEDKKYLDMAFQELSHAEQFQAEAKAITKNMDMSSPYLFYQETKKLEKCYHAIAEQRKKLERYV